MRAVVQRVTGARVRVGDRTAGTIERGLLVLLGVANDDAPADVQYIVNKVRDLRIFDDDNGKMNRTVGETAGGVLVVSQFTLCGDVRKGRRPSFDSAAAPAPARALYDDVVRDLRASGLQVETGEFQARMAIELVNDGPVTILLDSKKLF
jgi:D-tyrosyl-tRNA(Tyr) deacylase